MSKIFILRQVCVDDQDDILYASHDINATMLNRALKTIVGQTKESHAYELTKELIAHFATLPRDMKIGKSMDVYDYGGLQIDCVELDD